MVTNVTTVSSTLQPKLRELMFTRVEYKTPTGTDYSSGTFKRLRKTIVTDVVTRLGPDPSECILKIPVSSAFAATKIYDHKVIKGRPDTKQLAPFGALIGDLNIMSKVRIFAAPKGADGDPRRILVGNTGPRIFVGYVTEIESVQQGNEITELRIKCKDGRELLRKTPTLGKLFFNPDRGALISAGVFKGQTVFIRDTDIIFNEGQRPNRRHTTVAEGKISGLFLSEQQPRFINFDFNRFIDDPSDPDIDHFYIHDGFLTDDLFKDKIPNPHARKWFPGHVWNYIANLLDIAAMQGVNRLYQIPIAAIDQDELSPLWQDTDPNSSFRGEIVLPLLRDSGLDKDMFHDWFEPRSQVGATSQTGFDTAVSAIGEFNPTGMPVNEVLFELCRRIGNYTLAARYDRKDRMILIPIRTTQAFTENRDLPVGLQGGASGTGGGKRIVIFLPNPGSTLKPNVHTFFIKSSADAYYNRSHMKAGTRWAQCTFTTVARNQYTDDRGQLHAPYAFDAQNGAVPNGQWLPKFTVPTLIPGWTNGDETEFLKLFKEDGRHDAIDRFPDVFRTWIVPQDGNFQIDWVAFFDKATTEGFRRFFDRDRSTMSELITRIFSAQLGIFRNRSQRLPITVARAFRGIRIDTGGDTPYGGPETEHTGIAPPAQKNPVQGADDWFVIRSAFEVLTDGRLGIRFDFNARALLTYSFPGLNPPVPAPDATGETWNSIPVAGSSRTYEMLWTIPISLDEDLWEQVDIPNKGTARNINKFGPLMEIMRDAGNEYGMEEAVHSFINRPNPAGLKPMLAIPPVTATGQDDASLRIYRDDRDEVLARTRMMANRNAMVDTEANLTLPFIDLSLMAGHYVESLLFIQADLRDQIRVNSLCTSVTHDFQQQQTVIRLETIR